MSVCIFAVSIFFGCSKYTQVAEYSDNNKAVLLKVLDPTACDFARYIQVNVIAFGKEFGPFDLELLDCAKNFSRNDYKLVGNKSWVVLVDNTGGPVTNIVIAIDLVNKTVYEEKSGFPDEAKELVRASVTD